MRLKSKILKANTILLQVVFHVGDRFWARENQRPKNLKKNFSPNEVKDHAHYFTVLTYLAPSRATKLGIFIHFTIINLPWCSQMYTPYRFQLLFMSAWSQSWTHFLVLPPPKKYSVLPRDYNTKIIRHFLSKNYKIPFGQSHLNSLWDFNPRWFLSHSITSILRQCGIKYISRRKC